MNTPDNTAEAASWDTFWEGVAGKQTSGTGGVGVTHPGFVTFWGTAFSEFLATRPEGRIFDVGTGDGALIEHLNRTPGSRLDLTSCIDISAAAVDSVRKRFPGVNGLVGDAASVPLESASFDLIVSQFGIEYADSSAFDEAWRLLAPGGSLLFLSHISPGALDDESRDAIEALNRVREARVLELARDYFEAGFNALQTGERDAYDAAGKRLNPAIREMDSVLTEYGEHVAGDTVIFIYRTIEKMHQQIKNFSPDDVFAWLTDMQREITQYLGRMQSMRDSALDKNRFAEICESLQDQGAAIVRAAPLVFETDGPPYAWVLQATREIEADHDV